MKDVGLSLPDHQMQIPSPLVTCPQILSFWPSINNDRHDSPSLPKVMCVSATFNGLWSIPPWPVLSPWYILDIVGGYFMPWNWIFSPYKDDSARVPMPKDHHILNMSPKISLHRQNHSSAELVKEIAALEVEIVNLESYLLSLYRTALHRHLPSIPGDYGNHVKEITGISPRFTSDHLSLKSKLETPRNSKDQKARSSSESALTSSSKSIQIALPKPSPCKERKSFRHRSLADHFGNHYIDDSFISPGRLSEDIMRCISLIYCKLASPAQTHKGYSVSSSSSFCSSSTFSPRNLSGSWSPQCTDEISENCGSEGVKQDKGPYSGMVEVTKIRLDDESYGYAATMLHKFRSLVKHLEKIDLKKMRREEKLAFWINIHNALVMHAYLAYGTQNYIKSASIEKASYNVGGHHVNAYDIQSSILGIKSHYSAPWLQTLLSPGKKFRAGTTKHPCAIDYPEPLVHFALCSGSYSDPALRVYTSKHIFHDLKVAKDEFMQATVYIHKQTKIYLPKILRYYAKDVSLSMAELLEVVCGSLPVSQQKDITKMAKGRPEKHVYWLEQSASFRYLIDKEVAEMRWSS
ncbi:uncharacterized protein LOC127242590 [Andrographis paniculata]|uniref:uncharacterized protein LOC127242590 n=1 Tax=Andrographis paniculata TaxID=175694 RepID=UPI0021E84B48|nr:uncharacterized protein LOC127242590 [Andrographis paniculata]